MMDFLKSGCGDDDDDFEEDWMDTSWAQPNSHQQSEESQSGHQPKESRFRHQTDVSSHDHQHVESMVGADKPTTSAITSDSPVRSRDVAPDDPTVVKRMLLNDNKAGMEGLDKDRINQIIHEASKGSRFYENERKKEEEMKRKIEEQKQKISSISEAQLKQGLIEADHLLEDFEQQRDLSRTIVHIDMDAFYAAVEMRDDPSLRNKPMAVGGTAMLSTSNYHARKFGVRAAMPGFIGKKLCPDLVIVPLNFDKYTTVSKQVKSLIAEYDSNFCPMSLDEAYLDITEHLTTRKELTVEERTFICRQEIPEETDSHCFCDLNDVVKQEGDLKIKTNGTEDNDISIGEYFSSTVESLHRKNMENLRPECPLCGRPFPPFCHMTFGFSDEDIVRELRTRIEQRTRLTASAGIAPNMMLSKVCSDKNKPNGQYKIPATREAVMDFIKDLPTRKISGIGKVSESMLNAVGVYTCTDLYNRRALLYHLYSQISFNYFMRICLGIGSTAVERDSERKSISTERTFQELSKPADLYKRCEELVDSLIEDLKDEQLKGKTVSIKIKTVKFEVKTRAHSLPNYTNERGTILQSALDLLRTEIQACSPYPLRLRLMGVRMSNLANQSICKDMKRQGTILGAFKKIEDKAKSLVKTNAVKTECNTVVGNSAMDGSLSIETACIEDNDAKSGILAADKVNLLTVKENGAYDGCNKSSFELASNLKTGTSKNKDVVETGINLISNNAPKFSDKHSESKEQQTVGHDLREDLIEVVEENHIQTEKIHVSKGNKNMKEHESEEQTHAGELRSTNQRISEQNSVPVNDKEAHRTRSGLIRSNKKSTRKRRNSKPDKLVVYSCPICCKEISCASLTEFNEHVDDCLNEGTMPCTIPDSVIVRDSPTEIKHDHETTQIHSVERKESGENILINIDENGNEKKLMENPSVEMSNNVVRQVEELLMENSSTTDRIVTSIVEPNSLDNKDVLEVSIKESIDDTCSDKPKGLCTSNDKEYKCTSINESSHIAEEDKARTFVDNVSNINNTLEKNDTMNNGSKDQISLENKQEDKRSLPSFQLNSRMECEQNEQNSEFPVNSEEIIIERDIVDNKGVYLKVDQLDNSESVSTNEKDELKQKHEMTECDGGDEYETCNVSQIIESPVLKTNISPKPGCSWMNDNVNNGVDSDVDDSAGLLVCPVCNVEQRSADLNEFNSHVDSCLSRGAISQILKEQNRPTGPTMKRDRDVKKTPSHAPPTKKRKTILPTKSPSSCRTILSFFKDTQPV